jgi:2,3-diketo-5-methylthio-1-phosphopentane phosphatase
VTSAALFLDFDNTVTRGDVLDGLIERFSPTGEWRRWEADWEADRISTRECLARQVAGMRATQAELEAAVDQVELDPGFVPLLAACREAGVPATILSDNFDPLIRAILRHHRIEGIPVIANALVFGVDGPEARFPFADPACARCAHCKAQHLARSPSRPRVYVGDGLSDLCPARVADIVFAKDSLARHLADEGRAFRPFASLADVTRALPALIATPLKA